MDRCVAGRLATRSIALTSHLHMIWTSGKCYIHFCEKEDAIATLTTRHKSKSLIHVPIRLQTFILQRQTSIGPTPGLPGPRR